MSGVPSVYAAACFAQVSAYTVSLLEDAELGQFARELGTTAAQVELRFLLSLSEFTRVIQKSVIKSRILENIQLDFELSQEQVERLKKKHRNHQWLDPFEKCKIDIAFTNRMLNK
jgi:diketogulonate reductase-like aldo/keto reductase